MLLFKTIKLPIHIKRKKTAVGLHRAAGYHRKRKRPNKKMIKAAAAVFVALYGIKNIGGAKNNNTKEDIKTPVQESAFSVESGAYIESGLLNEADLMNIKTGVRLKMDGSPEILIFHTHSSEGYADGGTGEKATVIDAGNALAEIISDTYGVGVVHDVSAYDMLDGRTSTEGSYERSEEGVRKLLNKYPGIKVLIDIHRDSFNGSETNTADYNGRDSARLMLVNGVCALDNNGQKADAGVENPYISENISLSLKLKKAMDSAAPDIMKNVYIKPYRYSLNIMPCSLLLEAGNENNTIDEVKNSLYPFASALFNVLEEN